MTLTVGAEASAENRVEDLKLTLARLPKINLLVLDALIQHLRE